MTNYDDCKICHGCGNYWSLSYPAKCGAEMFEKNDCPLCAMRYRAEAAESSLCGMTAIAQAFEKQRDAAVKRAEVAEEKLEVSERITEIWKRNLQEVIAEREAIRSELDVAFIRIKSKEEEHDSARRSAAAWKRAAKSVFSGWGLSSSGKARNAIIGCISHFRRTNKE